MECGDCTLCCTLLELHEIPSDIGETCKHCDPNKGCMIHTTKPKECETYQCMWSQMENSGIELRPDKSHIIFDKVTDKTICARQDPNFKLKGLVLNQIKYFNKEGFSVVVLYKNQKRVYLAKGHVMNDIKGDIHDSSKLH